MAHDIDGYFFHVIVLHDILEQDNYKHLDKKEYFLIVRQWMATDVLSCSVNVLKRLGGFCHAVLVFIDLPGISVTLVALSDSCLRCRDF